MTFTRWAVEESDALVGDLSQILSRLIENKKGVKEEAAMNALVDVQASVIAARTRAGEMRRHFETASRMGEHAEIPAPKLDHKRAAANDLDDTNELSFLR